MSRQKNGKMSSTKIIIDVSPNVSALPNLNDFSRQIQSQLLRTVGLFFNDFRYSVRGLVENAVISVNKLDYVFINQRMNGIIF